MEESVKNGLPERVREVFDCRDQDLRAYSPLTLAYIGDAVYELVVRTLLVQQANRSTNDLNRMATQYVKAEAQAKIAAALLEELTGEEEAVYRRGRNAKFSTKAKNASAADYHRATGFEALMGYLYLNGQTDRMLELIRKGIGLAGISI